MPCVSILPGRRCECAHRAPCKPQETRRIWAGTTPALSEVLISSATLPGHCVPKEPRRYPFGEEKARYPAHIFGLKNTLKIVIVLALSRALC